jgi:branched-subunit amino acid aminotransferase/4-amino-4-deoxychorismate lyase
VGIASVRRCQQAAISGIKSTNYLVSILARKEAAQKGLDEALLLNDEGYIAEGGSSNVFFVKDSKLVTPSLNSGIIPGVTREVVMELAGKLGIKATEGTVGIGAIRKCEEIFITNSMIEIMPVSEVRDESSNSVTIGNGKPDAITRKLTEAYKERIKEETAA